MSRARAPGKSTRRRPSNEGILALVGHNVRRLRLRAELPIEEVAAQGGILPRTLREIEAGRTNITIVTVAKLAAGLDVDAEELFEDLPKR